MIRFKHAVSQTVIAILALMVIVNGCSPKRSAEVLARVGDEVITTDDFKNEVQWRLNHHHPLPDRSALLEEMISRQLALQRAKALGLETNSDVRRSFDDMLIGELKDRELAPKVETAAVSAEEIQRAYEHEIARYSKPSKTRLALIYMKIDRKMNPEQKGSVEKRMVEADKAARSLTNFARGFGSVAMDFSEDQVGRYTGGDVGWVDEGSTFLRWPKEVIQAGIGLQQIGQISPIVHASNGLYLVMKTDFRERSIVPLAQERASIQRHLLVEKKKQIEEGFARQLRTTVPVQIDPVKLSLFDYPTTTVAQVDDKMPPALPRSQ